MADLDAYERRFRRAGLPLWTRTAPLLALVFIGEMLGAIDLGWSLLANLAAALGGWRSSSVRSASSTWPEGDRSSRGPRMWASPSWWRSCSCPRCCR